MSAAPSQAYLKTKVLTATAGELRLMLLDGAVRFAEQTRNGYQSRDYERSYEGTTKCQAILTELLCSLRPERDPDLCSRLAALYTFMYRRMVDASSNKSPEIVEEVLKLLRYERETWSLVLEELAKGTAEQGQFHSKPSDGVAVAAGPARLSVQG
ncbi:MAG: flagellar export chaperone FliS [Phycisphaerae bacterium]|nr:flagellar export chaperone FliS [Phycisphaerae bacterium]